MPAVVGALQVIRVDQGVYQLGDSILVSPKSSFTVAVGSGSNNTGKLFIVNNNFNITSTLDTDLLDQPIIGNA
ncbi:spore germination protein [Heyndrickxia sp. NPDC080065]|uniref:spore germination protein n=1 Tax=Heyndrickxia sp. NPDC080065 TaxID=3390568 RepID=UPI003CFE2824